MRITNSKILNKWIAAFKDSIVMFIIFLVLYFLLNMIWNYNQALYHSQQDLFRSIFSSYNINFTYFFSFILLTFSIESFITRKLFQNLFENKGFLLISLPVMSILISTCEASIFNLVELLTKDDNWKAAIIPQDYYDVFFQNWLFFIAWIFRITLFNILRYYLKIFNW